MNGEILTMGTPDAGGALDADDQVADVPPGIREAARLSPDRWIGMVDPAWRGEGAPPSWATVGEWRSGPDGEIEAWRANAEYRPSPNSLGWPAPTDEVDEAIQLATTGYLSGEEVPLRLAYAEVAVLLGPGDRPLVASTTAGDAVIPVFTSPTHLQGMGMLASDVLPVSELMEELPEGHHLYVNPTGSVSMMVETEALRKAFATRAGDPASCPGPGPETSADPDFGAGPVSGPGPASDSAPAPASTSAPAASARTPQESTA